MKNFGNVRKSAAVKLASSFALCSALGYAISSSEDCGSDDADRYRLILKRFLTAAIHCVRFVPAPGDENYINRALDLFEGQLSED